MFVTPGEGVLETLVSTVDILPNIPGDTMYQKLYAPLHGLRTRVQKSAGGSREDNEAKFDSAIDRLLTVGALNPHLGMVGIKTIVTRLIRSKGQELTNEELEKGKRDRQSLSNSRYPLPSEAPKHQDHGATWLYQIMNNATQVQVPTTRVPILELLLKDSPKAVYVLREVMKAKKDNKKIIAFINWPLVHLYQEILFPLAEIKTISMCRKDTANLRRAKVDTFSDKDCDATVFAMDYLCRSYAIMQITRRLHKSSNLAVT